MISERSLYYKALVVLQQSRKGRHSSVAELINQIHARHPLCFVYNRRVEEDGELVLVSSCSRDSIARAIRLCTDLGMLEPNTGDPTSAGLRAANETAFPEVMKRRPPLAPTVDNISTATHGIVPLGKLSECLNLLSECGALTASRKKIYLPIS